MRTTMTEQPRFGERFEALMAEGANHLAAERYGDAQRAYLQAEQAAQRLGNSRAEDRAFVSRWAVQMVIERGLPPEPMQRMREIVMAGKDLVNSRLAAYNIARAYEFVKELRKGLFYAQIALDRSRLVDSPEWLASSHNQIGNFLLAQSRFEDAREEYEAALALVAEDEDSVRKAAILDNLGYTYVMLGRVREGVTLLYRSLRRLGALGTRREKVLPHLSLCFALLELGRHKLALRNGAKALALAEEAGEEDSVRQALFLLGEAAQGAGDAQGAREHFQRLQERYFSDSPHLTELLLAVDVRKLINLKA